MCIGAGGPLVRLHAGNVYILNTGWEEAWLRRFIPLEDRPRLDLNNFSNRINHKIEKCRN
jgi:hypothetical protein